MVEDKAELMRKLGRKQLSCSCKTRWSASRPGLSALQLELSGRAATVYTMTSKATGPASRRLLRD